MSTDNPYNEPRGPIDLPEVDGLGDQRYPDPDDDALIVPADEGVDLDPKPDPYWDSGIIPGEGYGEGAR